MSGIQCKDLIGGSLQIKNKIVLDSDCKLTVQDAKIKGDMVIKGNVSIEGELSGASGGGMIRLSSDGFTAWSTADGPGTSRIAAPVDSTTWPVQAFFAFTGMTVKALVMKIEAINFTGSQLFELWDMNTETIIFTTTVRDTDFGPTITDEPGGAVPGPGTVTLARPYRCGFIEVDWVIPAGTSCTGAWISGADYLYNASNDNEVNLSFWGTIP